MTTSTTEAPPLLVDVTEAADLLSVSAKTVRRLEAYGFLHRHPHIHGRVLFPYDEVVRFAALRVAVDECPTCGRAL